MQSLTRLRESNNMTQQQLAEVMGVSRSTVAMWETGKSVVPTQKLRRLSKILGCEISSLIPLDKE